LLQVAHVLRKRLPPEAAPASKPSAAAPSKKRVIKRAFDINDYPPGFDTGDATLNKAASLLRLRQFPIPNTLQPSDRNPLFPRARDTDATRGMLTLYFFVAVFSTVYVADLRRLQDRVNEIISQMQVGFIPSILLCCEHTLLPTAGGLHPLNPSLL
jgi:hypothetical protein